MVCLSEPRLLVGRGSQPLQSLGRGVHDRRPSRSDRKSPSRSPHPPGVAVLAVAEGLPADPLWSAEGPVWAEVGEPTWRSLLRLGNFQDVDSTGLCVYSRMLSLACS